MAGSVGQYTMGWPAWQARKSTVGLWTRTNGSADLSMGYSESSGAQNDEIVWPSYLDSVAWKCALIFHKGSSSGIYTVKFDGTALGTVDSYAAGASVNNYSDATTWTQATPKAADLTLVMATKNASSINYLADLQTVSLIRTGGTPSMPGGVDTPGYTWEWHCWMGSKGNTNVDSRGQDSGKFSGGALGNGGTSGDQVNTDTWVEARTYKIASVGSKATSEGIWTYRFDATDLATVDHYAGSGQANIYDEATGIANGTAGVKNFKIISNTKNASSSGYGIIVYSVKLVSTGA